MGNTIKCLIRFSGVSLLLLASVACDIDDVTNKSVEAGPEGPVTNRLIGAVCVAAARCDGRINESVCMTEMQGTTGHQIWNNFGLEGENLVGPAQIQTEIDAGTIVVNESALTDCLHELASSCDNNIASYDNVKNIVADGACPAVLQSSQTLYL